MSVRPDLLVLAADLDMHLSRVRKEVISIDGLVSVTNMEDHTLWALAGHLQAFYTGCETVISRALEKFDGLPDEGPDSHVRLVQQAALDVPGLRPPVLSTETAEALHPYRAFRHFFRHAYGVELVWEKMETKARSAATVFAQLEQDIRRFAGFLRTAANS